jgi:nicotinamidase/pyrazinamidase
VPRTVAAIVVDVQNDFCEGGSLAVAGGTQIARDVSRWLAARTFDHTVASRDFHIDPGEHFAANPNFVTTWPKHCVVGTAGVTLHRDLDLSRIEAIFDKGKYAAAYSAFEGEQDGVSLHDWLRERAVESVVVAGIATDHCVRATALDAARLGFGTTVELGLTAGVARVTVDGALAEMRAAGINLVGKPVLNG